MFRSRSVPSLALLVLAAASASAQTAGAWSDVFAYPGARLDLGVESVRQSVVETVEPDGQGGVYVGGLFTSIDGVPLTSVGQWDGQAWEPLGRGINGDGGFFVVGAVYDLLLARDGSLYVAGSFTNVVQTDGQAVASRGVARWTGTTWEPVGGGLLLYGFGTAFEGTARALAEAPDGAIYVAGQFDAVLGADGDTLAIGGVARWADGQWEAVVQVDPPRTVGGTDFGAVAVREDGTVAVSGISDESGSRLVIVPADDGPQPVLGGPVSSLAWVGDDLYVAGSGFAISTEETSTIEFANVARWRDGTWDLLDGGTDGAVAEVRPDGTGGVFVVGSFTLVADATPDPIPAGGIARWTGTAWTSEGDVLLPERPYVPFTPPGARAVAETDAGLVIGGAFEGVRDADDRVTHAVALAVRRDGAWSPLSTYPGTAAVGRHNFASNGESVVLATAPSPCGRGAVVGGAIASVGPEPTAGVGLWDGHSWRAFPGRLAFSDQDGEVRAIAPAGCEDGRPQFFAAGRFTTVELADGSEVDVPGVVHWDGTAWEPLGGEAPEGVVDAVVFDGQALYLAGPLAGPQPDDPYSVYRWQSGAGWAFVGGFDERVFALTLGPDGALYAGGSFTTVRRPDGTTVDARGLARRTGSTWEWIGAPTSGSVRALAFGPDGRLYAGGTFLRFTQPTSAAVNANSLAVWDGEEWTGVGDPGIAVTSLAVGAAGRVYAGFSPDFGLSSQAAGQLAVLDADRWGLLDVRGRGVATLTLDGADLYVGGSFTSAGPTPSAYLALYVDPLATARDERARPSALAVAVAPNPVRGRASVAVTVAEPGPVRVAVYDALGREVAMLWDGPAPTGPLALDASALRSGVYVARVQTATATATRTLTVVR
ncbi:T9SS type A sorting domain-containing protein [Rubrivirga sp.]|uniref:T9SS type A sorting domain-containing protein n=1 Tax=Rubrivirga sp. TaxID=1885344 RepID=UPI003B52D15C